MATGNYLLDQEKYARLRTDTEAALTHLATVPISMHCWHGRRPGNGINILRPAQEYRLIIIGP